MCRIGSRRPKYSSERAQKGVTAAVEDGSEGGVGERKGEIGVNHSGRARRGSEGDVGERKGEIAVRISTSRCPREGSRGDGKGSYPTHSANRLFSNRWHSSACLWQSWCASEIFLRQELTQKSDPQDESWPRKTNKSLSTPCTDLVSLPWTPLRKGGGRSSTIMDKPSQRCGDQSFRPTATVGVRVRNDLWGFRGVRIGEASHPGPSLVATQVDSVDEEMMSQLGANLLGDNRRPEVHILSQWASGSHTESVETCGPVGEVREGTKRRFRLRWSSFASEHASLQREARLAYACIRDLARRVGVVSNNDGRH